jgi:hypothetical protein
MNIEQQAAHNLAQRALASEKQSESDLLIASAKSLDPRINTGELKAAWLEKWLTQNQHRKANS